MKKAIGTMMTLAVLLSACNGSFTPTASAQTEPTTPPALTVEAEGKLLPDPRVELAFAQNGIVSEVYAEAGEQVSAGQALARLVGFDSAEAAVTAAEEVLLQARQELTDLKRAAVQSTGETELALRQARKAYDSAASGWSVGDEDDATDLELALDDYIEAEDDYYEALEDVTDLLGRNDSNQKRIDAEDDLERYEALLTTAYTDLQQVAGSQAYPLEEKPAKILAAIGVYEQARAAQARTNAENLDPEHLALAEAAVDSAEDSLAAAEETAELFAIRAPFDGLALSVKPQVGETALAGSPAVYLADPSTWVVETKDLAEVDIARVKIGQSAQVELDGLPGEIFSAHVTEIDPVGREYLGDMTYQVTLVMDEPDARFMWNMTAVVTIVVE